MNYSLVVRNVKNIDLYHQLSRLLEAMDLIKYVFNSGSYDIKTKEAIFDSWEEQKWDSFFGQMVNLSEMLPKMTFELTMQDGDSFSRMYFKDGISETCYGEVIYEAPKKIKWDSLVIF